MCNRAATTAPEFAEFWSRRDRSIYWYGGPADDWWIEEYGTLCNDCLRKVIYKIRRSRHFKPESGRYTRYIDQVSAGGDEAYEAWVCPFNRPASSEEFVNALLIIVRNLAKRIEQNQNVNPCAGKNIHGMRCMNYAHKKVDGVWLCRSHIHAKPREVEVKLTNKVAPMIVAAMGYEANGLD